jgi:DNA-binding GntR family transcriptional regulator
MVAQEVPEAELPPPGQRTATEKVMARLRTMLITGALAPGSRIDQADLVRRFDVSIVPIREALARMASAGLVEIVPHRGVFVVNVSADELTDLYAVREILEEQAAMIAVDRMTDSDIAELEKIAAAMTRTAKKGQLEDFLKYNREFHMTVYRASKRRHMLQVIEQLWDLSARYAHLQLHAVPDRAIESMSEVHAIVTACRRRDRDAVGLMVRYKIHQTTVVLLERAHLLDEVRSAQARQRRGERSGRRGARVVSR